MRIETYEKYGIIMQIQVNSDNIINADDGTIQAMRTLLLNKLGRFVPHLTRLEVHLKDVNSTSAGAPNIVCTLEARPAGLAPLTVDSNGPTIDVAVARAAGKMVTALDRTFGKLTDRKGH